MGHRRKRNVVFGELDARQFVGIRLLLAKRALKERKKKKQDEEEEKEGSRRELVVVSSGVPQLTEEEIVPQDV